MATLSGTEPAGDGAATGPEDQKPQACRASSEVRPRGFEPLTFGSVGGNTGCAGVAFGSRARFSCGPSLVGKGLRVQLGTLWARRRAPPCRVVLGGTWQRPRVSHAPECSARSP